MNTKHTPGAWTVNKLGSFKFEVRGLSQFGGDTDPVAVVDSMACDRKGLAYQACEANAHLISAAPDLLAALQMAVDGERNPYFMLKARAAIAKAAGP